jgi:hypothetical protein
MWVIREMIVSRQGKKPTSSIMATTTGSATTTTNNQGWNSRPNFPFNNQNGGNYSNNLNN